jgi:hypothetical protein
MLQISGKQLQGMEQKWTVDAAITRPFTHLCKARTRKSIAIGLFLKVSHDVRYQTRPSTSANTLYESGVRHTYIELTSLDCCLLSLLKFYVRR